MPLEPGSPVVFKIETPTGDPTAKAASGISPWLEEGAIEEIQAWIESSENDPGVIAEIERMVPASVFQRLNFPFTGSD